jgi:uncharacterized protein (DUF2062 family)
VAIISLSNWARTHFPTREKLEKNRWIRPFAHRVLKPDLWRFNRRSVPRGIALGLFTGIAIPFAHSPVAALCAVVVRANVPVAIATTWTSNPLTWALIFPAAIGISNVLGFHVDMTAFRHLLHSDASLGQWAHWLLSKAAPALMLGLLVEATVVAAVGYAAAAFGWRFWVGQKRVRTRKARHQRRA